MRTRGTRWRFGPVLLAAALAGACAREAPAPVEYRDGPPQAMLPLPPVPGFKPAPTTAMPALPVASVVALPPAAPPPLPAFKPLRPEPPRRVQAVPPPAPMLRVSTGYGAGPPRPLFKPGATPAARARVAAVPPPRRHALFAWPVSGPLLSGFGAKTGGLHNDGINIAAAEGAPVHAAEGGIVAYVGNELRGFGNLLLVRHADGWTSAYAHVDRIQVELGQLVARGQVVARVGRSGQVDRAQLHFELRKGREAVDPMHYLMPGEVARRDRAASRDGRPDGRPGPG